MSRIVAFDVETPNTYNDRICAIGLTVIENGEITGSKYYLVNPECDFDSTCIGIHGIRPKDVVDAPIFPEIWNDIRNLFHSHLVAFHSGSCFDLLVLQKTLNAYGIEESLVYYVDTVSISRALVKDTDNHKLPTLCERFNIDLNHHNAESDSYACAKLLCCLIDEGVILDRYTRSFDFNAFEGSSKKRAKQKISKNNQSLLTLNGILAGITCDDVLVESEVNYLQSWLENNAELQGNYPYDKIYEIISIALADGMLTSSELEYMIGLFKQITDPVNECSCVCDNLSVAGKNICLSGNFDYGSKADVIKLLTSKGAYIHETVKRDTDVLVVGGQGSDAWAAGSYGNKVKKALEMQAKCYGIQLFREADFLAALGG